MKAVIRRYSDPVNDKDVVVVPNLTIDKSDYVVTYHGKKVELPPKELELLYHLVSNPNRVYTREQLLDNIWGYEYIGETRTVDVHIKRLREKFKEEDAWEIKQFGALDTSSKWSRMRRHEKLLSKLQPST